MSFLNTTRRGPSLAHFFGNVRYKTTREQREIPENGPKLSLGATRSVGTMKSHFVAWRNGTGRVTFLQSSDPNLSYGKFDYITPPTEVEYADKFKTAFEKAKDAEVSGEDYDPTEYLSEKEKKTRHVHDACGVHESTKGQGDGSWFGVKPFTLSGTVGHTMLPRETSNLNQLEVKLLRDDLKIELATPAEEEVNLSWKVSSLVVISDYFLY